MRVSMIAAMANDRVIGKDNQMPWHLPADLKHFKRITMGHPVIMGRKTYESIGKALPGRKNIVISSRRDFSPTDATVVGSPEQALAAARGSEEVMIIGGGQIYQRFLPHADRLFLTQIELQVEGDTQFVDFNADNSFHLVAEIHGEVDQRNVHQHRFQVWQRK